MGEHSLANPFRAGMVIVPAGAGGKGEFMNQTQLPDSKGAREYFEKKIRYSTGPVELNQMLDSRETVTVVDVREAEDFEKGHIPGSINLPREQWSSRAGLRKDAPNVLVCYSHVCHLAAKAGVEFAGAGYPVIEMDGGFEAWKENDLEVEKGKAGKSPVEQQTTLSHP